MNREKSPEIQRNSQGILHGHLSTLYLMFYDILTVNFAYFFGLWLRFDFQYSMISETYLNAFFKFAPWYTVFCVIVFWTLRLYKSIWQFASFTELQRVTQASLYTTLFQILGITLFLQRMPVSYYMIGAVTQFVLMVAIRFAYRFILLERSRRVKEDEAAPKHRAMIIGAGESGRILIRELLRAPELHVKPCCVIDDNAGKQGREIDGVPIVGGRDDILLCVEKYKIDQILYAIPSASAKEKRDILNICKETGCELKSLPGVYQLVTGEVSISKLKDVSVEDLLGREPIQTDVEGILRHLQGKTILVTGGGGSIGSELCRQIAGHHPKQLIIFEIYENNAYDIEQELRHKYPDLNLTVLIGSVRDSRRLQNIFDGYRPQIVYHAAAHKHVPLMEGSPCEAIKNNVIGTYKTAYMAMKYGCERFVLISTDKAVNPTNIMGASKRLCEMVIQSMDMVSKAGLENKLPLIHAHGSKTDGMDYPVDSMDSPSAEAAAVFAAAAKDSEAEEEIPDMEKMPGSSTEFVAVRFGNVLGSNGSVIPLFRKQIAAGGPVTVTHPDIIRYFMTIPEAVSLVLQAGTYAKGGEIFVLDMGEPMKIDTLARNLIKLSGFRPDKDIQVVYTGLRPGEKLYEEKLMEEEGLEKTDNDLIHIGKPIPFDMQEFFVQLEQLAEISYENDDDIRPMVAKMVPTYHMQEE